MAEGRELYDVDDAPLLRKRRMVMTMCTVQVRARARASARAGVRERVHLLGVEAEPE